MKVVTVVGARPQFIKAAVVTRALRTVAGVEEILVHTGQHYDDRMSRIFFEELDIPSPDFHLGIGSGGHGLQTGRMMEALEAVLLETKPNWVLVYGDTNSTLAAALDAAKLHIPVAHVEAGLRSFNRQMPEEINRVVTDHVSELLFAPTETAVRNLRAEGIPASGIRISGDVMYDAALYYAAKAERDNRILADMALDTGRFLLATIHRAENTDSPARLRAIVEGLMVISREIPIVLPLHPRTRAELKRLELNVEGLPGLNVIEPLGYLDMVMLEKQAALIVTDSGGVQKEAYFHRVPCVTLRDQTEWVELVNLGWNRLVSPTHREAVIEGVRAALRGEGVRVEGIRPFGDGNAAQAVVRGLLGE